MFYSPSTGFTEDAKEGAYEITDERYWELLDGQSAGKIIAVYADGKPYLKTPDEPSLEEQLASAKMNRLNAYRAESDPLKTEADYDAAVSGSAPDYTAWIAKVAEIKLRYPLPDQ